MSMLSVSTSHRLEVKGPDAKTFIDSLISNSLDDSKIQFSYLLGPDGKVHYWFIFNSENENIYIYQELETLQELKQNFEKFKIRIKCEILLNEYETYLKITTNNNDIVISTIDPVQEKLTWTELALKLEIPTKKIINQGILPNEVIWLEQFVDYYKGCFLGQEQTSRVKFRGRPRRVLITKNNSQEFKKI